MTNRTSSFYGALSSGLLLRVAGAVVNFFAVPIAIKMIGSDGYAAFATLLGLAGWLMMGSAGLGGVTAMETAGARNDPQHANEMFWNTAILGTALVVAALIATILPFTLFNHQLLSNVPDRFQQELLLTSYYCFVAFAICAIGSIFEGRYVGLLRTDFCNWVRLSFQIISLTALFLASIYTNSMIILAAAMTIGTLGSALFFILKGTLQFPPPKSLAYKPSTSFTSLKQGLGFLASSIAVLFYGGGALPVIAFAFGHEQLATAAVMTRLVQMYFSLTAVLLHPLSAAIRSAKARSDVAWTKRALAYSIFLLLATSAISALVILTYGEQLISGWSGANLPALSQWLVPTAALLVAISWTYLWVYASFAILGSGPAAILATIEVAVIAGAYTFLGGTISPSSSMYIASAVMITISGTVLPILVMKNKYFRSSVQAE